jgi:hypothetical protein
VGQVPQSTAAAQGAEGLPKASRCQASLGLTPHLCSLGHQAVD